jgi:hypothetical protein
MRGIGGAPGEYEGSLTERSMLNSILSHDVPL